MIRLPNISLSRLAAVLAASSAAWAVSACGATIPGMTTGSLFGGDQKKAEPAVTNDPTSRAFQVAGTAARALKCGFNFDAAKLRTQYLAADAATADSAKLAQTYDVTFNATGKAIAGQDEAYCSPTKTTKIKEALNRHLAGDYAPAPPEVVEDDGGLFGSLGSNSSQGYRDNNPLMRNE